MYQIFFGIGGAVASLLLWILQNRMGAILAALGLTLVSYVGMTFIANTLIDNINAAFNTGVSETANGVPIGYLAYTMFRMCGGFDAILIIVSAFITKYSLLGLRTVLARLG